MLRQVFLLKDKKVIYRRSFALAYTSEEFEQVLDKINEFIVKPAQNQLFHRPIFNFQIVFGQLNDIFYIFVTDTGDKSKSVQDEIKTLSNTLSGSGLNVEDLVSEMENKRELDGLIEEIHYSLHPKITLIGPWGSGKTALAERLSKKGEETRDIMDFARVHKIQLGNLYFDLWDFILEDDFSPLWGNYIRGSDLVVFVFNSFEKSTRKIENFINLFKREVPFTRKVFLLSHSKNLDAVVVNKFQEQYSTELKSESFVYDITDDEKVTQIKELLQRHLELKRSLPPRFKDLIVESNKAIEKDDYPQAIKIIEQLIKIAEEYQELEYVALFRKKVMELKGEIPVDQIIEEKPAEKTFMAPQRVTFKDVITVKSLDGLGTQKSGQKIEIPSISSLTEDPTNLKRKRETTQIPRSGKFAGVKDKKLTFERSPLVKNDIVGLKPKESSKSKTDVADKKGEETVDKYTEFQEKKQQEKQSFLHDMFTHTDPPIAEPLPPPIKEISVGTEEERLNYEAELLHKTIQERGRNLSLDNCRTFIQQIQLKLNKDILNEQDILNAANLYVKKIEEREKYIQRS
ncbi:MAG: hypothetical protein JW776_14245 [Candidatus Lokiarchaeota archaeon]|nr:hypothetical protein [Candidatus Lokiarchaeota archaeon]